MGKRTSTPFEPGTSHAGESFEGQRFTHAVITAVDFTGACLRDTTWTGCRFDNDGMNGVIFRDADLSGATFEDCRFEIVHGEKATLDDVTFRRCEFGYTSFAEGSARRAVFEDVHIRNGLYLTSANCTALRLSVLAEQTYEPRLVDLVKADLRGAHLSARVTKRREKLIRDNEFREMKWSEFTIQKAKTDGETRFEYAPLPFDHERKPATPTRKLRKRDAVLELDAWGTIASLSVCGDLVLVGEGSWGGDSRRHGAKCEYRVAAFRDDALVWEQKLQAGSSSLDDVDVIAGDRGVFALAAGTAFELDVETGEPLRQEELDESASWVAPGVLGIYRTDHSIIRKMGGKRGKRFDGRWVECAQRDVFWAQLDYDQEASDWLWVIRRRADGEVLLERTGNHTGSCFSGDGLWFAAAWKKEHVEVYEVATGDLVVSFDAAPGKKRQPEVRALAMNVDGTRLAGVCGNQVIVWDADTGAIVKKLGTHEPPVKKIAFDDDDRVYVGSGLAKEQRGISIYGL